VPAEDPYQLRSLKDVLEGRARVVVDEKPKEGPRDPPRDGPKELPAPTGDGRPKEGQEARARAEPEARREDGKTLAALLIGEVPPTGDAALPLGKAQGPEEKAPPKEEEPSKEPAPRERAEAKEEALPKEGPQKGEEVEVLHRGRWWSSRVLGAAPGGKVRVELDGGEHVAASGEIRRRKDAAKADFQPGEEIEAHYRGRWFAGKIVRPAGPGKLRVVVDGREWDTPLVDIRRKIGAGLPQKAREPPEAAPLVPGDVVEVTYKGKSCEGKVTSASVRDRVMVLVEGQEVELPAGDARRKEGAGKDATAGSRDRPPLADPKAAAAEAREALAAAGEPAAASAGGTKTEMCRYWEMGCCPRGVFCTSAHGERELGQPILGLKAGDASQPASSQAQPATTSEALQQAMQQQQLEQQQQQQQAPPQQQHHSSHYQPHSGSGHAPAAHYHGSQHASATAASQGGVRRSSHSSNTPSGSTPSHAAPPAQGVPHQAQYYGKTSGGHPQHGQYYQRG